MPPPAVGAGTLPPATGVAPLGDVSSSLVVAVPSSQVVPKAGMAIPEVVLIDLWPSTSIPGEPLAAAAVASDVSLPGQSSALPLPLSLR